MALINFTLPTVGSPVTSEEPLVRTGLSTLQTLVNGNLDGANATALTAKYQRLVTVSGQSGTIAGTLYLGPSATLAASLTDNGGSARPLLDLRAADLAVTGQTARLRLRATIATNATAPAVTLTVGLYPVATLAGGSNAVIYTVGAAVATASLVSPPAAAATTAVSSDITMPTDGLYMYGVASSGSAAVNSAFVLTWQIDTRNT